MVPQGDEMAVASAWQPTKQQNRYFPSSDKESLAMTQNDSPIRRNASVNKSGKTVRAVYR